MSMCGLPLDGGKQDALGVDPQKSGELVPGHGWPRPTRGSLGDSGFFLSESVYDFYDLTIQTKPNLHQARRVVRARVRRELRLSTRAH